jgi:hypothetical protein
MLSGAASPLVCEPAGQSPEEVRAAVLLICLDTLAHAAIIMSAIHSSAVSITMKEPLDFSDLESISAGTRLPIFPPKGPLPLPWPTPRPRLPRIPFPQLPIPRWPIEYLPF